MEEYTPIEWLKINVANFYGKDKLDYKDRLIWFRDNQDRFLHDEGISMAKEADSPACFVAAVRAYIKALNHEKVSFPVFLDATASGSQIISLLTGDSTAAEYCNLNGNSHRKDIYTHIYELMVKEAHTALPSVSRKNVKKALLTKNYGSEAMPKMIFGEGPELDLFNKVYEENLPGLCAFNKLCLDLWDSRMLSYGWIMPDNFHVKIQVMGTEEEEFEFMGEVKVSRRYVNKPQKKGRSLGANLIHSIDAYICRELCRRMMMDEETRNKFRALILSKDMLIPSGSLDSNVMETIEAYKRTGIASVRIIEQIPIEDIPLLWNHKKLADALIEIWNNSVPEKNAEVWCIHDSFGVLPSHCNDLRKVYNHLLYEIGKEETLVNLLGQAFNMQSIQVDKSAINMNEILDANYAIC